MAQTRMRLEQVDFVSRGSAATSTRFTDDTGSGTAMNVVQPTIIMSYIIKT